MKSVKLLFSILPILVTVSMTGRSQSASNVNPVSFNLSCTLNVGNNPNSVAAADVNGDGKTDLISVPGINNSNSLIIFTNDGRGVYTFASSPAVGNSPKFVSPADVNGDVKTDLVSANYGDNSLSVLTNNGFGEFLVSGTFAVGNHPTWLVSVDVKGDGKMDLVSANDGGNSLSILTNDGFGGFVTSGANAVGNHPNSVTSADINADGNPDLICANGSNNTVSVLTNNGSGRFLICGHNTVGQNPNQVAAADINRDGQPDLITANYNGGTLTILTNDSHGGFLLSSTITNVFGVSRVVAADMNGDGSLDLISVPGLNDTVTVFTNSGSGRFLLAASLTGPGSYPFSVVTAEVNGDDRPDVICANVFGGSLTVLTNATQFPLPYTASGTATGIVVVTNGFVIVVSITDGGNGYTNTPSVRFIGVGGNGAGAYAVVSNGVVAGIVVTNAGYGYTTAPLLVIGPPFISNPILRIAPGSSLSFSNLTPGVAYQLQQFADYYWLNLPISFTASNTVYTQIVSSIGGTYRLAIKPVPTQAFATPQVVNGFIVGATLTTGGSGYVTTPSVNIVGNAGNNAMAVAVVSGGVVQSINIIQAGFGYTNAVSIQIDPPPVAAVLPTVQKVMRMDSKNLSPFDNYQIQFLPTLGGTWENWNGGLFSPTAVTNSQYLFITDDAAFFRLQHVP